MYIYIQCLKKLPCYFFVATFQRMADFSGLHPDVTKKRVTVTQAEAAVKTVKQLGSKWIDASATINRFTNISQ